MFFHLFFTIGVLRFGIFAQKTCAQAPKKLLRPKRGNIRIAKPDKAAKL